MKQVAGTNLSLPGRSYDNELRVSPKHTNHVDAVELAELWLPVLSRTDDESTGIGPETEVVSVIEGDIQVFRDSLRHNADAHLSQDDAVDPVRARNLR